MKKLLVLLLFPLSVFAGTLTWVPPTEREDNTPLPPEEIAGYNLYNDEGIKLNATLVTGESDPIDRAVTQQTVYVTTTDTEGRESVYSEGYIVPKLITKPKPPTGVGYAD